MRSKQMDRLISQLSDALNRSRCAPCALVEALLVLAAGYAVKMHTHEDCYAFAEQAHDVYHAAEDALSIAQFTEPSRAN